MAFLGSIGKALKKVFKKPLKTLLPIAGLAIPFLAPKIIPALGGLFGKIGGALGGSALAQIGGALGGSALLSYLLSGGRTQDQIDFSAYVPPHAQLGANVIAELLSQTPQLATHMAEVRRPFIEGAISSTEGMEGRVGSLYDTLLSQTEEVVNREMAKQASRLGALGLLNTQAMQWTTADILGKIKLPIMQEKTSLLSQIAMMKPELYAKLAELATLKDSKLLEYQLKTDLAKTLFGVPTVVQPEVQQGMGSLFPSIANILLTSTLLKRPVMPGGV